MAISSSLSIGGLIGFGTFTSLAAKIGEWARKGPAADTPNALVCSHTPLALSAARTCSV